MNVELVDSLAKIINSLELEERSLLIAKTNLDYCKNDNNKSKLQSKVIDDPEQIIFEMREERAQQIMEACFPNLDKVQSQSQE